MGGRLSLDDGANPGDIHVWLRGFNITTQTDEQGDFIITLPPSSEQSTPDGVTGAFNLYYFLANYRVDSTRVATRNGEFIYPLGEIDKAGTLAETRELKQMVDIAIRISPDTVVAGYAGDISVFVDMQTPFQDSALVEFPSSISTGYPYGTVVAKYKEADETLIFQNVVQNQRRSDVVIVGHKLFTHNMAFDTVQGVLKSGTYEIFPHLIIRHPDLPSGLLESIGIDQRRPGASIWEYPIKWEPGILIVN